MDLEQGLCGLCSIVKRSLIPRDSVADGNLPKNRLPSLNDGEIARLCAMVGRRERAIKFYEVSMFKLQTPNHPRRSLALLQ